MCAKIVNISPSIFGFGKVRRCINTYLLIGVLSEEFITLFPLRYPGKIYFDLKSRMDSICLSVLLGLADIDIIRYCYSHMYYLTCQVCEH